MTEEMLAQLPPPRTTRPAIPWLDLARHIAPVTAVDFCYGWFLVVFQTWIPSFFVQNYHLNLGKTALFSTAVLLAGVIGDTVGGVLSDWVLHRTRNLILARRGVIMLGFLGACAFLVPVLLTGNLSIATICLALSFFFAELIVLRGIRRVEHLDRVLADLLLRLAGQEPVRGLAPLAAPPRGALLAPVAAGRRCWPRRPCSDSSSYTRRGRPPRAHPARRAR